MLLRAACVIAIAIAIAISSSVPLRLVCSRNFISYTRPRPSLYESSAQLVTAPTNPAQLNRVPVTSVLQPYPHWVRSPMAHIR